MALIPVSEFGDRILLNSDHIASVEARKNGERTVLRINTMDDQTHSVAPVNTEGEVLTEAEAVEKGRDLLLHNFMVYVSKMNRF